MRYRKIRSKRSLEKIQNKQWECILCKENTNKKTLKNSYIILKYFAGCFIKADGIICKLKEVKLSPSWSCILFDGGGMQWFALGDYFNIYLPVKTTYQ